MTSLSCPFPARARQPRRPSLLAGFTLIEVMITVAIVAILAAVALPSYNDYIRRGNMPEAFSELAAYRAKMEQYFLDHRRYGTGTSCGNTDDAASWNTFPKTGNNFTFGCSTAADGSSFSVTATGRNGLAGYDYAIDHNGARTTTKFKGSTSTASCWLTKSGSC